MEQPVYKVVIPSAGLGSRLKNFSKHVNKALVTLANKPVIAHIIEKFPPEVEIVVALGYKKESVRDFLELALPQRRFTFVEVDKFDGEGSGLGYSLLCCKEHLQCPFIFISNDTIVTDPIPAPDHNWMGYAEVNDTSQYRSLRLDRRHQVLDICSKGATGEVKPYIGLAGIKDYGVFWNAMEEGKDQGSIEVGESYGMKYLVDKGINAYQFDWYDMGNIASLEHARRHFQNENGPNILEKDGEAIWFANDLVIKYSIDEAFIANRVARTAYLGSYVPEIVQTRKNMYAYRMVDGEIFSRNPKLGEFKYFLEWMEGFWKRKTLSPEETDKFKSSCRAFYFDKTKKRVQEYFKRFEQIDIPEIINGRPVPRLADIFNEVDWDLITDGMPTVMHGDLHFENILVNNGGRHPFTLLDWRQDFGGLLEYGDLYYDLAKLNHGLIVSHEIISKDLYQVNHKLDRIDFDLLRKYSLVECENYLRDWVVAKGLDYKKVSMITALIFLNIAPLHHYPYTSLLFYLGKTMLYETLHPKER